MKNNTILLVGIGALFLLPQLGKVKEAVNGGSDISVSAPDLDILIESAIPPSVVAQPSTGTLDFAGIIDSIFGFIPSLLDKPLDTIKIPDVKEVIDIDLVDLTDTVNPFKFNPLDLLSGDGGAGGAGVLDMFGAMGQGARDVAYGWVPRWAQNLVVRPKGNWWGNWIEIQAESESMFERADITEISTPADLEKMLEANPQIEVGTPIWQRGGFAR